MGPVVARWLLARRSCRRRLGNPTRQLQLENLLASLAYRVCCRRLTCSTDSHQADGSRVSVEELVGKIQRTFEPGVRLEPEEVTEHICPECADVAKTFAHHTWPEIPPDAIDAHHDSLPLFTPIAFRQFLPAYLVHGLQCEDQPWGVNDVSEFTVYALLPDAVDARWTDRVDGFNSLQVALISEFLHDIWTRGSEYLGPPPSAAASYWEARANSRRTRRVIEADEGS